MIASSSKNSKSAAQSNTASSSLVTPKIRIKYFSCTKGKDHQGEVLNYVCVKKDCQKRGLLCSMCKIDHQNHPTIPLKMLLSKLQSHKQKPLESSEGFQDQLAQIQQIHKTMLYNLRVCVENLAQKFREIQVQINDQFSKAKIELLERVQINMKFNSFIQQAISNKFQNREQFIQDMNRISGMIQVAENNSNAGKDKQLDIKFTANFELVVKALKNVSTSLSDALKKAQKSIIDDISVVKYEDYKNTNKKQKPKSKEADKQKQIKTDTNETAMKLFSPDFKAASITLENLQKLSKQSKTGEGRFVFTNFHITKPNQKIGFRIKTLKNWIGLGVAIRQKIKYLNFRFEYNNLGHGSYLISSNGYSWSHTETSNNIAVVPFKYKEGDIIQIQYEKTKLIYTNKSSLTQQKHELKLGFNEVQEKDIYFCANLCSEGDSVQIVDV